MDHDVPLPFAVGPEGDVDAVGLGLNALDHRLVLPAWPTRDERTPIASDFRAVGGQTAIAMATVVRLGGRARYLGTFGDDDRGREARERLEGLGVDVSGCRTAIGVANQFAVILLEEGTDARTILWRRDPALTVAPADLDPAVVAGGRVLLVDGHDVEACRAAAGWARAAGRPVVLDAEAVLDGTEDLVRSVDAVVADAGFAGRLTGRTDLRAALEGVADLGPTVAVATLGRRGTVATVGGRWLEVAAFDVPAVDTTGAGDVFHGAFVHGLLEGWPVGRTLRFASAAAAMTITRRGGPERIPNLGAVLEFLDRRG